MKTYVTQLFGAAIVFTVASAAVSAAPVYTPGSFSVTGVAAANGANVSGMPGARSLLSGSSPSLMNLTSSYPLINFGDPHDLDGHFGGDVTPFTFNTLPSSTFYALHATATVLIPTAGWWSFGVNNEGGFTLQVGGLNTHFATMHNPSDTIAPFYFTSAGLYPVDLTLFAKPGRSDVELCASPGKYKHWKEPRTNWQLVGDTAEGGIEVVDPSSSPSVGSPLPEPSTFSIMILAMGVLGRRPRRS